MWPIISMDFVVTIEEVSWPAACFVLAVLLISADHEWSFADYAVVVYKQAQLWRQAH